MAGVRAGGGDVLDQGDLALDHVFRPILFVPAPVGDGDGKFVALLEEDEGRHREEPVDRTRDVAKFGAGAKFA